MRPGPGGSAATGPGLVLNVWMMEMMGMSMVVVMMPHGKRRSGKHHQEEHGSKNLFHGMNVTRYACQR